MSLGRILLQNLSGSGSEVERMKMSHWKSAATAWTTERAWISRKPWTAHSPLKRVGEPRWLTREGSHLRLTPMAATESLRTTMQRLFAATLVVAAEAEMAEHRWMGLRAKTWRPPGQTSEKSHHFGSRSSVNCLDYCRQEAPEGAARGGVRQVGRDDTSCWNPRFSRTLSRQIVPARRKNSV